MRLRKSSASWNPPTKTNQPTNHQQPFKVLLVLCCAVGIVLAACAPPAVTPLTAAPTQPLIPAQPTRTPIPTPQPTPTREPLPAAADLALTSTAQSASSGTGEDAALLIEQARADLSQREPAAQIVTLDHESVTWRDANLECDSRTPSGARRSVEGYRIRLLIADTVYDYHTDSGQQVRLCAQGSLYDDYPNLFLMRDPVAAEMAALAGERLGRDLDLSSRLITLISARPMEWPDTSLGCPVDGQVYAPAVTRGYRLEFEVNAQRYIFHTDFESILPCSDAPPP